MKQTLNWVLTIAMAGCLAAAAQVEAFHPLPGPHFFDCEARGNDVSLSWDHLGVNPDTHETLLYRDDELITTLDPDAVSHLDEDVAAGAHTYRLDIVATGGAGGPPISFSCDVVVVFPSGLRCKVFGGIAIPPVVSISWDPLPLDLEVVRIDVRRDGEQAASLEPEAIEYQEEPQTGEHLYTVEAILAELVPPDVDVPESGLVIGDCLVFYEPPRIGGFQRGDCNGDAAKDLSDAVCILIYLFQGVGPPACLTSADTDDSGALDLTDAVYLIGFLFLGQPAPPAPFPGCGDDPTPDDLGCEAFPPCFHPPPP